MEEEFVSREKKLYGRKIFFVNASFNIEQVAKGKLRDMEYETYIIEDFRQVKNILRKNPDSMCFINLDYVGIKSLTSIQYLNFILSCEQDPDFSSILFGVLSVNTSPKQMNLFFYNVKLPCGYIPVSPNKEEFSENLANVLDVNGAKGRRQYVRASCQVTGNAFVSISANQNSIKLPLVDFSSVGLACKIPEKICGIIPPNTSLTNVDLWLFGTKLPCPLIVLREFKKDDINVLVSLFSKAVGQDVKKKVRECVFKILEENLNSQMDQALADNEVYSLEPGKKDVIVDLDDIPVASDSGDFMELEEI